MASCTGAVTWRGWLGLGAMGRGAKQNDADGQRLGGIWAADLATIQ